MASKWAQGLLLLQEKTPLRQAGESVAPQYGVFEQYLPNVCPPCQTRRRALIKISTLKNEKATVLPHESNLA